MPLAPEGLIHAVLVLCLALVLVSLSLSAFAVVRRMLREREFRSLDALRSRVGAILEGLRDGTVDYEAAMQGIRAMLNRGPGVERLLLERADADADYVQRLAEDLGMVGTWRRSLRPTGLRRLPGLMPGRWTRARSADNLGRMRQRASWRLLVAALEDRSSDVRRAALRSLARIRDPQSFSFLVEYARQALTERSPKLSDRELRASLACFPVELAGGLLPLLRDRNPRLQLLAADVLIQMLAGDGAREDVRLERLEDGSALVEAVLNVLMTSESAEVRARMSTVLGHASGEAAESQLRRLLHDREWFVRLRAARAISRMRKNADWALVSPLLTDQDWRVRETATRLLARSGAAAVDRLLDTFLSTRDPYAREQIAQELHESGELARIGARCAQRGGGRDFQILSEVLRLGKSHSVETALRGSFQPLERATLLARLASSSDSSLQRWDGQMGVE